MKLLCKFLLTLILLGAMGAGLGSIMAGCQPLQMDAELTPRGRLEAFIGTANATLRALAQMRAAGMLNEETIEAVTEILPILDATIRLWQADIDGGRDPTLAIQRAQRALDELIAERIKALNTSEGGKRGDGRTRDSPDRVDPAAVDWGAHATTQRALLGQPGHTGRHRQGAEPVGFGQGRMGRGGEH